MVKKLKKKKDNQMYWIIGVALLVLLWYGGQQGWFKSSLNITNLPSTTNPTTILPTTIVERLENPVPTGATCTLSLSKSVITAGDLISGTIRDGKNSYCAGYGKLVGTDDWRKLSEGTTDISGILTYSDNLWVEGDYIFAAMCDTNGNGGLDAMDCVTNEVSLRVNPGFTSTCVDSDGKNKMTVGHVTSDGLSYYDDCAGNWAVKEYWCNGNVLTESIIGCDAGYICTETRSGDYCGVSSSGWEVGDIVFEGSKSGSIQFASGVNLISITPSEMGFETGGTCSLEVELLTSWNWREENTEDKGDNISA